MDEHVVVVRHRDCLEPASCGAQQTHAIATSVRHEINIAKWAAPLGQVLVRVRRRWRAVVVPA